MPNHRLAMYRVALTLSLLLLPGVLHAQPCSGGASFDHRLTQIGATTSFSENAHSDLGTFAIGAARGPFASIGVGSAHDDNLGDHASVIAASAGVAIGLITRPTTELCPFLSLTALSGINLPNDVQLSTQAYGVGVSIGTALTARRDIDVVPFATVAFAAQDLKVHRNLGIGVNNANFYDVSLGAGFVFQNVFTVRPSATFTVAGGEVKRSYAVDVTLGVGGVGHPKKPLPGEGSLVSVWVNPRARVYYCPNSRWYGGTADGSFMTEREALAAGYTPEFGKRC